jgi:peptidyl-tRNA hydrolase, PTH1 family
VSTAEGPLLIVGLGNPGKKYDGTRHNVGFEILDAWAEKLGASFAHKKQFLSFIASTSYEGRKLLLIKPDTYMNLSGSAVRKVADYYGIETANILVVTDDIYLPLGQIRFRQKGSAGGHNGLKDIQNHLGTSEYARLRVGVGAPGGEQDLADYVLDKFTRQEKQQIEKATELSIDFLDQHVRSISSAENQTIKESYESEG